MINRSVKFYPMHTFLPFGLSQKKNKLIIFKLQLGSCGYTDVAGITIPIIPPSPTTMAKTNGSWSQLHLDGMWFLSPS